MTHNHGSNSRATVYYATRHGQTHVVAEYDDRKYNCTGHVAANSLEGIGRKLGERLGLATHIRTIPKKRTFEEWTDRPVSFLHIHDVVSAMAQRAWEIEEQPDQESPSES